jgi:hypothetical protein
MTTSSDTTSLPRHRMPFWLRELPYLAILLLTALGAAYFSMTRQPMVHYWDLLALFIAIVCIATGWRRAASHNMAWHLVWTQALHWAAFLVAMNIVFLPSVQALLNANTTSLFVLFQLALGTFVAGVHAGSAKLCINGAAMALMVPAVAWLDQSALMLTIIALVVIAAAAMVLWRMFGRVAQA